MSCIVEGCGKPHYHCNPLISPLLEFHGRIVKTAQDLPEDGKAAEITRRIAYLAVAPFVYLALAFVALVSLIFDKIWENKQIIRVERDDLQDVPPLVDPPSSKGKDDIFGKETVEALKHSYFDDTILKKQLFRESLLDKLLGEKFTPNCIANAKKIKEEAEKIPSGDINRVEKLGEAIAALFHGTSSLNNFFKNTTKYDFHLDEELQQQILLSQGAALPYVLGILIFMGNFEKHFTKSVVSSCLTLLSSGQLTPRKLMLEIYDPMSDDFASQIAQAIAKSPSLIRVTIMIKDIKNSHIKIIADALTLSKTITKVTIQNLNLELEEGMTPKEYESNVLEFKAKLPTWNIAIEDFFKKPAIKLWK